MATQVEAAPGNRKSLTDPDARSMATSGRGTGMVGDNVQAAVDTQPHEVVNEAYLAAAKVVFACAVENRKLDVNPASGVSVRVPKRRHPRGPSFTSAEVRTIL